MIERQYLDQQTREAAVRTQAADLLKELADRELLSSSVDDLPLENPAENETLVKSTETERKVGVTSVQKGETRTALIMISENTPDHAIGIYVQPEIGESYAHVNPKDDSQSAFSINLSRSTTKLESSSDCEDFVLCTEEVCDGNCGAEDWFDDRVYYIEEHYTCYKCGSQFEDCCCELEGTDCRGGNGCYCSGSCDDC